MMCAPITNQLPIVTSEYYRSQYVDVEEGWNLNGEEIDQFEDEVYDCFQSIMRWTEDDVLEEFDEDELKKFSTLFDECKQLYTFAAIPLVGRYISNRNVNILQCAYERLDVIAMNSQPTTKMVKEILAKVE